MQNLLVQVVIVALAVKCAVSQSCSLDTDGKAKNYTNVLILGAGISGIAAARTLEVNGMTDFLVIEAYNRIGGRIREYDGIDKVRLEVGANWIQGLANDKKDWERHPIWREWLRCSQSGPEGSETPDDFTHVYDVDGTKITKDSEYVSRRKLFDSAFKMAKKQKSSDISDSLEKALNNNGWVLSVQSPLDEFIEWEGVDFCSATQPGKISQYHHSRISYETDFLANKDNKAKNYLMADNRGFSYVVDCLASNFKDRIKLNSKITKIKTANDCVCVTVEEDDLYCGRYSIVTFSIGVLRASINDNQTSFFRFEPRLPQKKRDALNNITPVHYGKIHLQFDANDRFWDDILNDKDQQILGNVATERGYYPYFIFDKNRPRTVTADVTGDLAERVAVQSRERTVSEVMAVLRKMFPNKDIPEPDMDNVIISNWSIDPLFLCTYSVIPPKVSKEIFKELLEPVNGSLYFAGEALNGSNSGFTQGGYGSGVCVAKLLLGEKPVVGLEKAIYTVSEDGGEVEVCVVVKSECNVPFPFNVVISTRKVSEISDSPKILKFDAHVKKNCTNIKFSINDTVLGYGEVLIISISLQSISGQYSGIRLLTNKARVDVIDYDDTEDNLGFILVITGLFIFCIVLGCISLFIFCVRKKCCNS